MYLEGMNNIIPLDWHPMDVVNEKYKIIKIPEMAQEYLDVSSKVSGNYYINIEGIYKLQNPFLYTKFTLKAHEYRQRGFYEILSLYHDTTRDCVQSICMFNFDWRFGERYKYGPGVYFSISPILANKYSCKNNSPLRTMFIADVLVQNVQKGDLRTFLPGYGFDTVLGQGGTTFVKYFDCEYYPKYFVDYISRT